MTTRRTFLNGLIGIPVAAMVPTSKLVDTSDPKQWPMCSGYWNVTGGIYFNEFGGLYRGEEKGFWKAKDDGKWYMGFKSTGSIFQIDKPAWALI